MNFDSVRNAAYARQIRAAVTPASVVLDLGAGLGMLGMIAARAGAKKVYLVDPEPVIEVTRKVAAENRLLNVECIQSKAETLELPEEVDLIVSVMTGNFLLTEDLLPSLFHARDQFLKPSGRMIPDFGRMIVLPVSCPDYYQKYIENWSREEAQQHNVDCFGIDYGLARRYAVNSLFYDTVEKFAATPLAPPCRLLDLDFMTAQKADCDAQAEFEITESGRCYGWLGWFDMRLGNAWLSTGPDAQPMHWRQVFLPLEMPLDVEPGQLLSFSLKRPEFGEWSWVSETRGERQSQSTFLSLPLTPHRLARNAENHRPVLEERGRAIKFLIARFDGQHSVGDLADEVLTRYPDSFGSRQEALRLVRLIVNRNT